MAGRAHTQGGQRSSWAPDCSKTEKPRLPQVSHHGARRPVAGSPGEPSPSHNKRASGNIITQTLPASSPTPMLA
ncbi:hypothetical protein VZT92_014575 [Zoarces viviparus]|uniref:Uncharacterized protein n=1 Tax=Zoarces viviparus TaxID=48416 RepID=A0AAW1EZQ9_ZOAVI